MGAARRSEAGRAFQKLRRRFDFARRITASTWALSLLVLVLAICGIVGVAWVAASVVASIVIWPVSELVSTLIVGGVDGWELELRHWLVIDRLSFIASTRGIDLVKDREAILGGNVAELIGWCEVLGSHPPLTRRIAPVRQALRHWS